MVAIIHLEQILLSASSGPTREKRATLSPLFGLAPDAVYQADLLPDHW